MIKMKCGHMTDQYQYNLENGHVPVCIQCGCYEVKNEERFLYAIINKTSKQLINRKCGSGNPFYSRRSDADRKLNDESEKVIKYKLVEIQEG